MKYTRDLEKLKCHLVREGSDYDFLLLDRDNSLEVKKYLLSKDFILFKEEKNQLNFKKFEDTKLIDIDIDIDLETEYFHTFFYDIFINDELKQKYFNNPQKYKRCINTIRYILLLRGFNKKYFDFFKENKKYIEENSYCLEYLNIFPFRKKIKDFDEFLKLIKRDTYMLLKYIKVKYLLKYLLVKIFKKRGKLVAFLGIDGSGKSTIIDILHLELGHNKVYLGDRSIRFGKFYQINALKPFSIFIQYFEKLFRVIKIKLFTLRGKTILSDRYYFYIQKDNGIKRILYNAFYNIFFIKPDVTIVLYESAEVILERKKEVTKEQIEEFYTDLEKLKIKNSIWIKNSDLDTTLNEILKILAL